MRAVPAVIVASLLAATASAAIACPPPDGPRSWTRVAPLQYDVRGHRELTVAQPLIGAQVASWTLATDHCAPLVVRAFEPVRRSRVVVQAMPTLAERCLGPSKITITARYRDGSSEIITADGHRRRGPADESSHDLRWLWVTGFGSFALLAGLLYRERRGTAVV